MNVIRKNDENPNAVASILDPVQRTLTWIDPILQFLSKSTGEATVPAPLVARAMPWKDVETCHIQRLIEWGILVCVRKERNDTMEDWYKSSTTKRQSGSIAPQPSARFDWDDASCFIGFPSPGIERLHGCSKTAAKRRMAALLQRLNEETTQQTFPGTVTCDKPEQNVSEADMPDESKKIAYAVVSPGDESGRMTPTQLDSAPTKHNFEDNQFLYASEEAQIAFESLFGFSQISIQKDFDNPLIPTKILPHQASYAGSCPAQPSQYADLSQDCLRQIPPTLLKAFGLPRFRRLYSHQTAAIETVMSNRHCSICTGTGSGKSLCFLLPALTAAFVHNQTSLLLFPTKALAQDQLSKLLELLATDEELSHRIRPATLDGDTPYSARSRINECNIILTNPDTLHAAVLPSWKNKTYRSMLPSLRFIVIDEAHTYDGIFGAHVAMIVRRLIRVHAAASRDAGHGVMPTFVSASATLPWPEHHFRRLCAIPKHIPIRVLTGNEDGSPRSAKHFFVWNPPVLSVDGTSTDRVYFPRLTTLPEKKIEGRKRPLDTRPTNNDSDNTVDHNDVTSVGDGASAHSVPNPSSFFRRHAADETAGLLARAVTRGVRCIAFCKTRNLVEWVFQKTTEILKSDLYTSSLASRVESYRGGYTMKERRKIEEKMFRNEIIGIVGTNALELGIDLGGIDLTLHCGYPSSYSSLLQQVRWFI
jgi:DEAD/DEAH box helicase domain-containing protein